MSVLKPRACKYLIGRLYRSKPSLWNDENISRQNIYIGVNIPALDQIVQTNVIAFITLRSAYKRSAVAISKVG